MEFQFYFYIIGFMFVSIFTALGELCFMSLHGKEEI